MVRQKNTDQYLMWEMGTNYILTTLDKAFIEQSFSNKKEALRFIKISQRHTDSRGNRCTTYIYDPKTDRINLTKLSTLKFEIVNVEATFKIVSI